LEVAEAAGVVVIVDSVAELTTDVLVLTSGPEVGRGECCSDTLAIPLGWTVPEVAVTDPDEVHSIT
jgi:hypothetical protein